MRNLSVLICSAGVLAFLAGFPMYFVLSPRDPPFVWLLATAMCWGGPVLALVGVAMVFNSPGRKE